MQHNLDFLVCAAQAGHQQAVDLILQSLRPAAQNLAKRYARTAKTHQEELAQEALSQVWNALQKFSPGPRPFRPYAIRTMHNWIRERVRETKRRSMVVPFSAAGWDESTSCVTSQHNAPVSSKHSDAPSHTTAIEAADPVYIDPDNPALQLTAHESDIVTLAQTLRPGFFVALMLRDDVFELGDLRACFLASTNKSTVRSWRKKGRLKARELVTNTDATPLIEPFTPQAMPPLKSRDLKGCSTPELLEFTILCDDLRYSWALRNKLNTIALVLSRRGVRCTSQLHAQGRWDVTLHRRHFAHWPPAPGRQASWEAIIDALTRYDRGESGALRLTG